MPFDQHKNLAIAVVAVAPSPSDTGLTLTVAAGHGVRYPVPPFDVTIWLATKYPNPDDAEVARCTALAGDVLTLVRAQGGTTARLVQVGDLIAESITAQYLQSLEAAIGTTPSPPTLHAPTHETGGTDPITGDLSLTSLTASGDITSTTGTVTAPLGNFGYVNVANTLAAQSVTAQTVDASSQITAPLGRFGTLDTTPLNATNLLTGTVPDARLSVNVLTHPAGYPGGTTNFLRADGTFAAPAGGGGGMPAAHASTHYVGGSDPITGALSLTTVSTSGNVAVGGDLVMAPNKIIRQSTTAGADTGLIQIFGGGGPTDLNRGAAINIWGKNGTNAGGFDLYGATGTGAINLAPGGTLTGRMWASGGFSWGAAVVATDPDAGNLSVAGSVSVGNPGITATVLSAQTLRLNTADGNDNGQLILAGGGAATAGRGATIKVYGNEGANLGSVILATGDSASGRISFHAGAAVPEVGRMHPSGGFSWGSTTDPGAGNLSVSGHVIAGTVRQQLTTNVLTLSGGSDIGTSAFINIFGSAYAGTPAAIDVVSNGAAGIALSSAHASGVIKFHTATLERGRIHASGGFSWGGTADPGAGQFTVAGHVCVGHTTPFTYPGRLSAMSNPVLAECGLALGMTADQGAASMVIFYNAAGGVNGTITQVNASTVAYNTTSDARLKTSLSRHTDTAVLRDTVIHDFIWKSDGLPGRGVFAQEAVEVAPFAVSVGTDDLNEQGHLAKPWGVDYSKFVPDLIVGWQSHDAKIAALEAKVAKLEAMIEKLLT